MNALKLSAVEGVVTRVAVAPHRYSKGIGARGRSLEVEDAYDVLELTDALTRTYATDAHLVTNVIPGAVRQPRINMPGLRHASAMPVIGVFFCDIDNAGHAEWTDALIEETRAEDDARPALATAGIYYTAHGRRIAQPIATPIAVADATPYMRAWIRDLGAAGLAVDADCLRWSLHYRLPNVRRAGRPFRSPCIALDRMRAITLARPSTDGIAWAREVPAWWVPKIAGLAGAARGVAGDRDSLFSMLASGLLARRVLPDYVPAICRAVARAIDADAWTFDRELSSRRTVERYLAGKRNGGFAELRRRYPAVAEVVAENVASGAESRIRAQARETAARVVRPLAETLTALDAAIRDAPDGLTLISAECGLGKTQAAIRVAAARAQKAYATPHATGARAPSQSKTAISVDKTALAMQVTDDLRASGASVKRIFGPLSLLRDDKKPECRYHAVATPLVEGGQSLSRLFCKRSEQDRCPDYDTCRARSGVDGPDDARIVVGPHALLGRLHAEAGTTGLLVIDEPPALLDSVTLTLAQLDAAIDARGLFDALYATALTPALRALRTWAADVAEPESVVAPAPADAVRRVTVQIDPKEITWACMAARITLSGDMAADALACVRAIREASPRHTAPPIRKENVHASIDSRALARTIGAASKVFAAVVFALTTEERVAARVEVRSGERALVLTHARTDFVDAIRREGATVILDANADLQAPLLAKVVDYTPPTHQFFAADGAPIERALLRTRSATRQGWLTDGHLKAESDVDGLLRRAVAWACARPNVGAVGLVTFRPLALAIRLARSPDDPALVAAWAEAGHQTTPEQVRDRFAPLLASVADLRVAHYGAVRGLDSMKDVGCLVTLGDPWPHLGVVRHDVAFLGLVAPWEKRVEGMCRAELEQAHGRLRVVHRERPARALHVGNVLPGGTGWAEDNFEFLRPPTGRPPNEFTMPPEEVRSAAEALGGIPAAARKVGCGRGTMSRYASGERGAPLKIVLALRALVTLVATSCDAEAGSERAHGRSD